MLGLNLHIHRPMANHLLLLECQIQQTYQAQTFAVDPVLAPLA